ncbi:MAG: hypothetical protein A3G38_00835 [Omnitrophica WOR_2 bacterium RIFCSPLOWO2_12_FULL_51_8]|nr:MAG: hypothetical protein A3G38_00835 [Omnitrophica WOR_2 bacterium RIFCSPLOWO2_12_FULL_51_8]
MSDKRGAILLLVIIVILTVSLIGATLIALFNNIVTSSRVELDRTRALYLAEAGIAQAVNALRGQAAGTPLQSEASQQIIPPTQLGEGNNYFEVYHDLAQSTITSIGSSNSVKRTLQVKYNAF